MKSCWCLSTPLYWHYWCSMRFWPLTILFLNRLARQLTFAGTWVKRATYYVLYKNLHKHCSLIYCPYVMSKRWKQFAVLQFKGLDSKVTNQELSFDQLIRIFYQLTIQRSDNLENKFWSFHLNQKLNENISLFLP